MAHETLLWLEFSLQNKLVSGLNLEGKTKKMILIGLSDESMDRLPMHARCLAQRKVLSTLESIKWAAWDMVFKWMVSYAWFLAWQPFVVLPILLWCCRKLLFWVLRRAFMWALRKVYAKVKILEDAVKRALSETFKGLMAAPSVWHRATDLRDIVKKEMHPGNPEDQARFCEKIWPLVVQAIASDERVCVRQRADALLWKWKGNSAQVH